MKVRNKKVVALLCAAAVILNQNGMNTVFAEEEATVGEELQIQDGEDEDIKVEDESKDPEEENILNFIRTGNLEYVNENNIVQLVKMMNENCLDENKKKNLGNAVLYSSVIREKYEYLEKLYAEVENINYSYEVDESIEKFDIVGDRFNNWVGPNVMRVTGKNEMTSTVNGIEVVYVFAAGTEQETTNEYSSLPVVITISIPESLRDEKVLIKQIKKDGSEDFLNSWDNKDGTISFVSSTLGVFAMTKYVSEEPSTEVPSTEVPSTEVPSTEVPSTEVPSTEVPSTEVPSTEAPSQTPSESGSSSSSSSGSSSGSVAPVSSGSSSAGGGSVAVTAAVVATPASSGRLEVVELGYAADALGVEQLVVSVKMNGNAMIPANVFEKYLGKNVLINVDVNDGTILQFSCATLTADMIKNGVYIKKQDRNFTIVLNSVDMSKNLVIYAKCDGLKVNKQTTLNFVDDNGVLTPFRKSVVFENGLTAFTVPFVGARFEVTQ